MTQDLHYGLLQKAALWPMALWLYGLSDFWFFPLLNYDAHYSAYNKQFHASCFVVTMRVRHVTIKTHC